MALDEIGCEWRGLEDFWSEPEPEADGEGGERKAGKKCGPEGEVESVSKSDGDEKGQAEGNEDERFAGQAGNFRHVVARIPGGDEGENADQRERKQESAEAGISFRQFSDCDDQDPGNDAAQ